MKNNETFLLECLQNCNSEEWVKSLACRLEPVRGYLGNDEWTKGISPWLQAVLGRCLEKLLTESASETQYHYARGFVAALRVVIALPATVQGAIEKADQEQQKKQNPGRYTG